MLFPPAYLQFAQAVPEARTVHVLSKNPFAFQLLPLPDLKDFKTSECVAERDVNMTLNRAAFHDNQVVVSVDLPNVDRFSFDSVPVYALYVNDKIVTVVSQSHDGLTMFGGIFVGKARSFRIARFTLENGAYRLVGDMCNTLDYQGRDFTPVP